MLDPVVEIVPNSGAFILSDIINGYRIAKTYYFYTLPEALADFQETYG